MFFTPQLADAIVVWLRYNVQGRGADLCKTAAGTLCTIEGILLSMFTVPFAVPRQHNVASKVPCPKQLPKHVSQICPSSKIYSPGSGRQLMPLS